MLWRTIYTAMMYKLSKTSSNPTLCNKTLLQIWTNTRRRLTGWQTLDTKDRNVGARDAGYAVVEPEAVGFLQT